MSGIELRLNMASYKDNVDMIVSTLEAAFNKSNNTLPFWDRVVKILPEIDGKIHANTTRYEMKKIVGSILEKHYENEKDFIQLSIKEKSHLLNEQVLSCVQEMFRLFSLECRNDFTINCYVGFFNPFPRDVIGRNYYIHYNVANDIFVKSSLHEINHMVLFEKWKSMHGYLEKKQPEFPHPLWYLEELSIEPMLNTESIYRFAPFKHVTYDSFYQTIIEGKTLPYIIQEIYNKSSSIEEYLDNAYNFLEKKISDGLIK